MNETIKGWIKSVPDPVLRLFLGCLILTAGALYADNKIQAYNQGKNYRNTIAAKDEENRELRKQLSDCKDDRYHDVQRQADRLENRIDKQDSAKQILSKIK